MDKPRLLLCCAAAPRLWRPVRLWPAPGPGCAQGPEYGGGSKSGSDRGFKCQLLDEFSASETNLRRLAACLRSDLGKELHVNPRTVCELDAATLAKTTNCILFPVCAAVALGMPLDRVIKHALAFSRACAIPGMTSARTYDVLRVVLQSLPGYHAQLKPSATAKPPGCSGHTRGGGGGSLHGAGKECNFGRKCKREGCSFLHSQGRMMDEPCRYGSKCTNTACGFRHSNAATGDNASAMAKALERLKLEAHASSHREQSEWNESSDSDLDSDSDSSTDYDSDSDSSTDYWE